MTASAPLVSTLQWSSTEGEFVELLSLLLQITFNARPARRGQGVLCSGFEGVDAL